MRRALPLAVSTLVGCAALLPTVAHASCIDPEAACLCERFSPPPPWIVKARALGAADASVEVVFASSDAGAPAVSSVVGYYENFNVQADAGDWVLIGPQGEAMRLSADGTTASCQNVSLPVETWAAAILDGGCDAELKSRGFQQPKCEEGPCGCSASTGALLGALFLVALTARRGFHRSR